MTPEGKVKAALKKALKEAGAFQHWPVQNGMGAACLDCHGCYEGFYFSVETKAPGKKPTLRQEETMYNIGQAGGAVYVVDSIEKAKSFPNKLEELVHARLVRYHCYQGS